MQREPIIVSDLLASVKRALEPQRASKRVSLLVKAADDLPPMVADYRRLRQTLINVLSNALRHAPDDSEIRVEASADDSSLRIVVHDQGPGLRDAELTKVFDRFTAPIPRAIAAPAGTDSVLRLQNVLSKRTAARFGRPMTPAGARCSR